MQLANSELRRSGVTLIEVLVSIFVASIGLLLRHLAAVPRQPL